MLRIRRIALGLRREFAVVGDMIAAGWAQGSCIVATKVSRDRARLMADRLKAIRSALVIMEGDLRAAAAQAESTCAA